MPCIYKVTNLINGKSYIGQTVFTAQKRWNDHMASFIKGTGVHKLQYAVDKYGIDNFALQTIEECTTEELNDRERYWIDFYDTYENGYNSTLGGQDGAYKLNYRRIADKYLELLSLRKTAELMKCSVQTVQAAIRTFGIDASTMGKDTGKIASTKDYQELADEYMKNPKVVEVAKKFGTSPARVSKAVKEVTGKTPKEHDAERRSSSMRGQKRGSYNSKK